MYDSRRLVIRTWSRFFIRTSGSIAARSDGGYICFIDGVMLAEPWTLAAGGPVERAACSEECAWADPWCSCRTSACGTSSSGVCHLVIARIAPDVARRRPVARRPAPRHPGGRDDAGQRHGPRAAPRPSRSGSWTRAWGRRAGRSRWRPRSGPRLVGPDNGLLSFAWRALGGVTEAVRDRSRARRTHARVRGVPRPRRVRAGGGALVAGAPARAPGDAARPGDPRDARARGRRGRARQGQRRGRRRRPVRQHPPQRAAGRPGAGRVRRRRHGRGGDDGRLGPGAARSWRTATSSAGEYGMLVDAWDWVAVIRYEASAAAAMDVTRGDPVWIALAS